MKVYLQILKVMRFSLIDLRQSLYAIYLVRLRDTQSFMYM